MVEMKLSNKKDEKYAIYNFYSFYFFIRENSIYTICKAAVN